MHNQFFAKVQNQFSGGRICFPQNDAGTTEHPQAKRKKKKNP